MTAADPWKVLKDFLSPEGRRAELLDELRENQRWLGTLKAVQATFPNDAGLVASCAAFIHHHLYEIERITEELKKNDG